MSGSQQIRINLLQRDDRRQKQVHYFWAVALLVALLGGSMGFLYRSAKQELARQQLEHSRLTLQIENYQEVEKNYKANLQMKQELSAKRQRVEELEELRHSYVDLLEEVAQAVPPRIFLESIEIKTGVITLNGFSPDHGEVAVFLAGLRESPVFKNVTVLSSQVDDDIGSGQFRMELEWKELGS